MAISAAVVPLLGTVSFRPWVLLRKTSVKSRVLSSL